MSTSESLPLPDFGIHACKLIPYLEAGEICLAFTEISLVYPTINRNERKLVIFLPPDARSVMGPRALVQYACCLVNLLDIAGWHP